MGVSMRGQLICVWIFFATLLGGSTVLAQTRLCENRSLESVPFSWCADFGDRQKNQDLVYNFHGSSGDADDWLNAEDNIAIRDEWKRNGIPAPTIVTISFGEEWFLTEISVGGKPPLYSLIVQKIIPFIEKELGGLKGRRFLKGVSMGGFNGVELLLKNGELFDRVALVCPVIMEIGPYSSRAEVDDYLEAHKHFLNREMVEGLIANLRDEFPTHEDYDRHDPLTLIAKTQLKTPQLYISCGDHDEYGFFWGSEKFARLAQAHGSSVIWDPKQGGHCVADASALAAFLAP
jgi:pimeloyl-ACP methyl ester carboxylesterase